ncbi:MAG: hypothetical protein AAF488_08240 [Planctomycetota bacterium]
MSSRKIVGAVAGIVLIAGVVAVGLRLNEPVQLIPESVEVVISAPGAAFYVGDDYRGHDEVVLRPKESISWTDEDLGLTRESSSWNPLEVLPRLYPDSELEVHGSRSSGLSAAGIDRGYHVQGRVQAVGAHFSRDGVADDFLVVTLRLPDGGTHDHRKIGRWMIRIGKPGAPRSHLANPRIEIEVHSSSTEEWLLRRARYSVRILLDAEFHPANPRLGLLWIERAEAERAVDGPSTPAAPPSPTAGDAR